MFGENKCVQISTPLGRKLISALLVYSFVLLSFVSAANAQKMPLRPTLKPESKQKFSSDVRLDGFQADAFSGATKISWNTGFEQNVLGFKVWRDDKGERILVNENLVTGSLLKVSNGILEAGNQYSYYDL